MNKIKIRLLALTAAVCLASSLSGCVASMPPTISTVTSPTTGATVTVTNPPTFIVSPSILNTESNIQAVVGTVGGVVSTLYPAAAPAATAANSLLTYIFGALFSVSTVYAAYKTQQSANHQAAAAALASVVQPNPTLAAQAITNSVANGSTATVATHLANAAKAV